MNYRSRGFDPEQFFGPEGPFGPRGPLGPGGIFGPAGPFGTGGGWGHWSGEGPGRHGGHGPRVGGRGRPRARRGDVRNAILGLLGERGPMNGYQLMQAIADETEGRWTPSSGAIYPALSQLEDEGLVAQTEVAGRKAYELTEAGRAAASEGPSLRWNTTGGGGEEPDDPWAEGRGGRRGPGRSGGAGPFGAGGPFGGGGRRAGGQLWKALGSVAMATQAVGQAGDPELTTSAAELLERTRRDLYRLLAEAEVARDDDWADATDDVDEVAEGEIMED